MLHERTDSTPHGTRVRATVTTGATARPLQRSAEPRALVAFGRPCGHSGGQVGRMRYHPLGGPSPLALEFATSTVISVDIRLAINPIS